MLAAELTTTWSGAAGCEWGEQQTAAARQQCLGATEPLPVSRNSRLAAARMDDELFLFLFFTKY